MEKLNQQAERRIGERLLERAPADSLEHQLLTTLCAGLADHGSMADLCFGYQRRSRRAEGAAKARAGDPASKYYWDVSSFDEAMREHCFSAALKLFDVAFKQDFGQQAWSTDAFHEFVTVRYAANHQVAPAPQFTLDRGEISEFLSQEDLRETFIAEHEARIEAINGLLRLDSEDFPGGISAYFEHPLDVLGLACNRLVLTAKLSQFNRG